LGIAAFGRDGREISPARQFQIPNPDMAGVRPLPEPCAVAIPIEAFNCALAALPGRIENVGDPFRALGGEVIGLKALTEFGAAACTHSIVAQLVHIANAWRVYEHAGQTHAPVYDLDHMIAHIVRFSVAGIRATQESEATP